MMFYEQLLDLREAVRAEFSLEPQILSWRQRFRSMTRSSGGAHRRGAYSVQGPMGELSPRLPGNRSVGGAAATIL